MKVCVTGGAGFIGSHLVDRLLADGHEVSVLDNLCTGHRANLAHVSADIRFELGDLRDEEAVRRAVAGSEVVFHQAALASVERSVQTPKEVTDVNVGGTLNVLMAARDAGARRVVFASSSSVYGDTPTLPKIEAMPVSPRSPYAASKVAGEAYLAGFQGVYDMECVATRYFNVFGPRQRADSQYAAVIPLFINEITAGRPARIQGDGTQTRDFTYVGDVVEAVYLAATTPSAPKGPYNLGSGGNRTSILKLAEVIAAAVGFEGDPIHLPPRVGDVRDSLADISLFCDWTGWSPAVSLEEGIAATLTAFGHSADSTARSALKSTG